MSQLALQLKKLGPIEKPSSKVIQYSLLFDQVQASKIDAQTIHGIAIEGLKELIKYDSRFKAFQDTLFSPSSQNLSRAQQTEAINKKTDEAIETFLRLLSPFSLLRCAHQTIEYLIRRYQ